jgi:hypothetical protein
MYSSEVQQRHPTKSAPPISSMSKLDRREFTPKWLRGLGRSTHLAVAVLQGQAGRGALATPAEVAARHSGQPPPRAPASTCRSPAAPEGPCRPGSARRAPPQSRPAPPAPPSCPSPTLPDSNGLKSSCRAVMRWCVPAWPGRGVRGRVRRRVGRRVVFQPMPARVRSQTIRVVSSSWSCSRWPVCAWRCRQSVCWLRCQVWRWARRVCGWWSSGGSWWRSGRRSRACGSSGGVGRRCRATPASVRRWFSPRGGCRVARHRPRAGRGGWSGRCSARRLRRSSAR